MDAMLKAARSCMLESLKHKPMWQARYEKSPARVHPKCTPGSRCYFLNCLLCGPREMALRVETILEMPLSHESTREWAGPPLQARDSSGREAVPHIGASYTHRHADGAAHHFLTVCPRRDQVRLWSSSCTSSRPFEKS